MVLAITCSVVETDLVGWSLTARLLVTIIILLFLRCKDTKSLGKLVEFRREISKGTQMELFLYVTQNAENTERRPSQMAGGIWRSPEGEKLQENCSKNYSKYKAITDGNILESPEGEKLKENLVQNYTKYKGVTTEGVNSRGIH